MRFPTQLADHPLRGLRHKLRLTLPEGATLNAWAN